MAIFDPLIVTIETIAYTVHFTAAWLMLRFDRPHNRDSEEHDSDDQEERDSDEQSDSQKIERFHKIAIASICVLAMAHGFEAVALTLGHD